MTPERKAEIEARLEALLFPKPLPKPKVVARNDLGEIRDADVHVSRADPNSSGKAEVVNVRRPEYVTVNMWQYESQQVEKAWDREYRRQLDPYRLGLYGSLMMTNDRPIGAF